MILSAPLPTSALPKVDQTGWDFQELEALTPLSQSQREAGCGLLSKKIQEMKKFLELQGKEYGCQPSGGDVQAQMWVPNAGHFSTFPVMLKQKKTPLTYRCGIL